MIDQRWLEDRLVEVLRWQLGNPGRRDGPIIPWAGQRVWGMFLELSAARGSSGFGPSPIAPAEIEAWSRLRREPVRAHELDLIRALDLAFLKAAAAKSDAGKPAADVSTRPMTPQLFDALFGAANTALAH